MRLAALLLALGAAAAGQDGVPASSNVPGSEYPRILSDHRVIFRLKAPGATSVKLQPLNEGFGKTPLDLTKAEDGTWMVTTRAVPAGFHYYAFLVDGVQMNDPSSRTYFGYGRDTSGLEVPGPGDEFYAQRNVPHGEVHIHQWWSGKLNAFRTAWVYTPPGYDTDRGKRYPVLYLQHGAGEDERGWIRQGRANLILDNLIAQGKARPFLVVMENGYATGQGRPPAPGAPSVRESFDSLMTEELIWNIDASFRTLAEKENRAIAGLSMGAGEAFYTGLKHPDLFSYVAGMSGGTQILEATPATAQRSISSRFLKLLWIGYGTEDGGYAAMKKMHETMQSNNVPHVWFETSGTHEWQVWRKCLLEVAPRLFQR